MKFLYIILAIYVLILSVKPCCADDNCSDDFPSKTEQTGDHQHDNDCKGNCSPFFTCGSCVGFTFTETNYFFKINIPFVEKNIVFNHHKFVENYLANIWQPPKIS